MQKARLFSIAVAIMSVASAAGAQGVARRGGLQDRGLLRGLNLTADEKVKLKGVHEKYKAQAKTLRESMKPAMQEARAARQKGDTASARAIFQRTENSRTQ